LFYRGGEDNAVTAGLLRVIERFVCGLEGRLVQSMAAAAGDADEYRYR